MIEKPKQNIYIVFQFTISFIILMIFSGCAKNIPSDRLSSAEITEKQVEGLVKKAEVQLDHFSNECMPGCVKKKQKMFQILDLIEDTVSKLNLDSSSIEMDDFSYTASYIREKIEDLGNLSTPKRDTKDKIENLKNELHELQANIDEVYLVAQDESGSKDEFSLKKKITSFMIQRRMGILARDDFGL